MPKVSTISRDSFESKKLNNIFAPRAFILVNLSGLINIRLYLLISAEPPSLKITVNGSVVGTGSGTFEGKAGTYKIVGKDAAQGITVAKTVKLKPGQTMNVELEAQKASLAFDQLPDGVEVFVDGKRIGKTPLASLQLWAGPHKVVVKKGAQEIPYKLTIPAGREAYLTADFN